MVKLLLLKNDGGLICRYIHNYIAHIQHKNGKCIVMKNMIINARNGKSFL